MKSVRLNFLRSVAAVLVVCILATFLPSEFVFAETNALSENEVMDESSLDDSSVSSSDVSSNSSSKSFANSNLPEESNDVSFYDRNDISYESTSYTNPYSRDYGLTKRK